MNIIFTIFFLTVINIYGSENENPQIEYLCSPKEGLYKKLNKYGLLDFPTDLQLKIIKSSDNPEKLFAFMSLISKEWPSHNLVDHFIKYMVKERGQNSISIVTRIASPVMENYVVRNIHKKDESSSLLEYRKRLIECSDANGLLDPNNICYSPGFLRDLKRTPEQLVQERVKQWLLGIRAKRLIVLSRICGENIYENELTKAVMHRNPYFLARLFDLNLHRNEDYISEFGSWHTHSHINNLLAGVINCFDQNYKKSKKCIKKKQEYEGFDLYQLVAVVDLLEDAGQPIFKKNEDFLNSKKETLDYFRMCSHFGAYKSAYAPRL